MPSKQQLIVALFAALISTMVVAEPAGEEDSEGWALGKDINLEVYVRDCAACHGEQFQGGALGPNLLQAPLKRGNELEDIVNSITQGFPDQGMPAWNKVHDESQIRRIAMLILEQQAGFTYTGVDPFGEPLLIPTAPISSEHYQFKLKSVAQDLQHPFSIAPLPDGRILYTEKSVGLSILSTDGSKQLVEGTPRVYDDNIFYGAQLIGTGWIQEVALHPDYQRNGWIYLSYGDRCSDCNELSKTSGQPVSMLQVVRGRIEDNRWLDEQTIWRADTAHYRTENNQGLGARMAFDHKNHLYFTVAALNGEVAQQLDNPYGKIMRLEDDGRIPKDNPYTNISGAMKSIWSRGHRNPQGLDFDERNKNLWSTEHGPRGGDELNLIEPGGNYGWPMVSYGMWYDGTPVNFAEQWNIQYDPDELIYPIRHWTPSPGISSIAFYRGKPFSDWNGNLLVMSMRKMQLRRLEIKGEEVIHEEVLLDGLGRFRDVEVGADGNLYLLIEEYHGSHIVKMSPYPGSGNH